MKNVQMEYKKLTREDIEICQIALNLSFYYNLGNRTKSLVYPPAHQHVLAVTLTYFTDTYHVTEIFMENLK